jgi:hypothetical protein
MDAKTIAHYTGLEETDVNRFLRMYTVDVYKDKTYLAAVQELDKAYLEKTLQLARSAYEQHIETFKDEVKARYGLTKAPMSAFTLGNWVVGVLQYPASAGEILNLHKGIKGEVISGSLQDLLDMLNDMPEGAEQWQQALCLLSFPLMNK